MSIQAIPAGCDPPGGTNEVSYTAGTPSTRRPTGDQWPSPAAEPPVDIVAGAGSGCMAMTLVGTCPSEEDDVDRPVRDAEVLRMVLVAGPVWRVADRLALQAASRTAAALKQAAM